MIVPAGSVTTVTPLAPASSPQPASGPRGEFRDALQAAIAGVENASAKAGQLVNGFLNGETEDLHTVALASQRASLQFEMFLQVRNKVVQAYQEVMRMQL